MATHSSILAWETLWTEELGKLHSMGSQESDTTSRLNHHHGGVRRNLLRISMLFSTMTVAVYVPTTRQYGSLFSTPSPAFIVCSFSDDGCYNCCEIMPHSSFDFHFSNSE